MRYEAFGGVIAFNRRSLRVDPGKRPLEEGLSV